MSYKALPIKKKYSAYVFPVVLFILLFPFYLLPSGNPQIADLCLVPLFATLAFSPRKVVRLRNQFRKPIIWLSLFAFYASICNVIWGVASLHFSMRQAILTPIYYIYNSIVFISYIFAYLKVGKPILNWTLWGVLISVVIQVVLSPFASRDITRQIIYFNNPNQLGYYAIICATFFMISGTSYRINIWLRLLLYLCTAYLAFISVSKAALASIVIILVFSFLRDKKMLILSFFICFLLFYGVPSSRTSLLDWSDPFIGNATRAGNSDSLEGRAYDRIWTYPEHLVIGAGEGGFTRFHGHPREMHTSIGTLLFSYGIFGTLIFIRFLYLVMEKSLWINTLYLSPIFAYSLTHQALRFSLVWILTAFLLCSNHYFTSLSMRKME